MSNTVMSASIRANLLSLQNTTAMMDKTQLNLSTGKKVNSALDDATSFFAAKSLTDRAGDLNKLLDSMGQNISGIKQAATSVASLTKLVDQANAIAGQARDALAKGTQEAKVAGDVNLKNVTNLTTLSGVTNDKSDLTFTVVDKDGQAVTLANAGAIAIGSTAGNALSIDDLVNKINSLDNGLSAPVLEAKVNDAGKLEIKALNGGTFSVNFRGDNTDGTTSNNTAGNLAFAQALGFTGVAEQVADGGEAAGAQTFDVRITTSAKASLNSVALYGGTSQVAKASDKLLSVGIDGGTSTKVLTQGATAGNKLVIGYNGMTSGFTVDATTSIQDLVDQVNNDSALKGKLEMSFDDKTGKLNIRALDASVSSVQFGVEETTTTETSSAKFGFGVKSTISSLNTAASATRNVESIRLGSAAGDLATFEANYNKTRDQIDALVKDAGYRGTNLLNGDTLLTVFNEDRSTSISTKGAVLTSAGMGLNAANFGNATSVEGALTEVRNATGTLRTVTSSLANDLNVIQTREDFTKQTVNTLQEGSDKLTVADPNEEGATMLALQTRQQLAVQALSLASQAQQSVLSLLR